MDSGELDFYQHDKVCSNTCRSTKIDLSGARVSLSSPTSTEYIPLTPAAADGRCTRLSVLQVNCSYPDQSFLAAIYLVCSLPHGALQC